METERERERERERMFRVPEFRSLGCTGTPNPERASEPSSLGFRSLGYLGFAGCRSLRV